MKVLLMHPEQDFDADQPLPGHAEDLDADLALPTLLQAAAGGDRLVYQVMHRTLLGAFGNDVTTIEYRQAILRDVLAHGEVIRELYAIATEALERKRKSSFFGFMADHPSSILHGAIAVLTIFLEMLLQVRNVAQAQRAVFASAGFVRLFDALIQELSDDYLAEMRTRLAQLRFEPGVLIGAELGDGNESVRHRLHLERDTRPAWIRRMLGSGGPAYRFQLAERDEAGARFLGEIEAAGINLVANTAAQAMDHIAAFFEALQTELAFYVGALTLHEQLNTLGVPLVIPRAHPWGSRVLHAQSLSDPCLALQLGKAPATNALRADTRSLIIITGANQGGKSSFLRGLGLAHLMLNAGLFVAAACFEGEICRGLYTHHKREEDMTLSGGKFDEELRRLDGIADAIVSNSLVLFNESFASTNEREGSEMACEVVDALLERKVRVVFVTHQYAFASAYLSRRLTDVLYLRAERATDGRRSFRLLPGEPQATSYGEDLYRRIFGS